MTIETPWEASIDWAPDFPRGSYVFDSHGNEIAGPIGGDEADLIAAAPDLLETCERLLGFAHHYASESAVTAAHGLFEAARAAILKAKGQ